MKKSAIIVLVVFSAVVICSVMKLYLYKSNTENCCKEQGKVVTDNRNSSNETYNNEAVNTLINDYSQQYNHLFMPVPIEMEEKLYGVWQVKGYAGYRRSSRYQWDGFWGDIFIVSEDALIYDGMPYFRPVYAYYESCAEDMETDAYLDLAWIDERYLGLNGIVMLAICEGDNGELIFEKPYRLILINDFLLIESGDSYFELEKVGEAALYDSFADTAHNNQSVSGHDMERKAVIDSEMSNSERYYNETANKVKNYYKEEYGHSFATAGTEMEAELYGIWQTKECVGCEDSFNLHGKSMAAEVIIFNENAWIHYGRPSFKPVYLFYEERSENMKTDKFLGNLIWKDERYAGYSGIVIVGIYTEENNKFGSGHQQEEPLKLIMIEGCLIIEKGGFYFEMQKIGEVDMYDSFINVKPY